MNLTFAFGAQGHAHVGAEPAAERVLDTPHFGSDAEAAFHPRPALGSATASHAIFNFAHLEALCDCFAREIRDDARILQCEQRARVPHRQLGLVQHLQHDLRQLEQAQGIGDHHAAPADFGGGFLLFELKLIDNCA